MLIAIFMFLAGFLYIAVYGFLLGGLYWYLVKTSALASYEIFFVLALASFCLFLLAILKIFLFKKYSRKSSKSQTGGNGNPSLSALVSPVLCRMAEGFLEGLTAKP